VLSATCVLHRDTRLVSVPGFEVNHVGRLEIRFELLGPMRTFGPGGLQLPLQFIAGSLTGSFGHAAVLFGSDWASITGAGLIRHCGDMLLSLENERLHVQFRGLSRGQEKIVDDMFDQILPGPVRCRLWFAVTTESRHVSRLDRQLLVGIGSYDFRRREVTCEVFSVD
jgi:hypothetical protein